jgi:hypothetical protein
VEATADKVGLGIVAGVTGAFALHGVASAIRAKAQPVNRTKVKVEEE